MVVLTVHVITSAGMVGMTATLVAFQFTEAESDQIWKLTNLFAARVLTPTAAVAFASGLVLAIAGSWGLLRWRWVIAKLQISAVLTGVGLASITGCLEPLTVLVARCCALVALVCLVAVSVVKPWGRTPRWDRAGQSGHLAAVS
jgi:peptidoglycan/LPS O-acetylase OafA/YrhL